MVNKMTSKKCDTCSFRGTVAGSTHSSCNEPLIKSMSMDLINASFLSGTPNNGLNRLNLNSSNSQYTIMFPMDYDPIWLEGHCMQHSDNDIVDAYVIYQRVNNGIVFNVEQISELRLKLKEKNEKEAADLTLKTQTV